MATALSLTAACGSAPSSQATGGAGQDRATVTNCGDQVSYEVPTRRIVATSNSADIGTLLRVGAARQLAAIQLTTGNDAVMKALYGTDISGVPRLKSPVSMESIVAQRPDLLIGSYSGLFGGASGVTPESAKAKGIPTYVISDSCRQDPAAGTSSKLGTMGPWDAVRADLANYGTLTGHQAQAAQAVDELDSRLSALQSAPKAAAAPKILLFDSGTNDLYTSGRNGPPQGIIDAAGGVNVFADQDTTWFHATWESVAAAKPDVIVVMDYRSGDAGEVPAKLATLRNQPSLKNLPVIKNNRIVVMPLSLVTSGFPNIEAADELRVSLEKLGLEPDSDVTAKLPAAMYGIPPRG